MRRLGARTADVGSNPGTVLERVSSGRDMRILRPRERTADVGSNVGSNPNTLLERMSDDRAKSRLQRQGERTADVGLNPGTLLQQMSGDKAQTRVQSQGREQRTSVCTQRRG